MATILAPGARVLDANGLAINGGKVRVYNANTTTLSTLYSDVGLTVSLSNPVICNSEGYPTSDGSTETQIFAAAGNYDVAFLSAGNVVLRTWDDVPALGSDDSTFTRDFTNARVAIRASGGVVYFDAGDPSPDNSGGTLSVGGWLGTQADALTLNALTTNTTGTFTENSKKLPGIVTTAATAFTAVSNLDITLPNSPTGTRVWTVDLWDLVTSNGTDTNLYLYLSYDNGATYKSGASDYAYQITTASGASTLATTGDDAHTNGVLANAVKSGTNEWFRATLNVTTVNSGVGATIVQAAFVGALSGSTTPMLINAATYGLGGYGRATNIRIAALAGNIAGSYRVVPQRGFGDA